MLRDGIGDAMKALEARDDGEGWHKGWISSCELSKEVNKVEILGGGLRALVWPLELL